MSSHLEFRLKMKKMMMKKKNNKNWLMIKKTSTIVAKREEMLGCHVSRFFWFVFLLIYLTNS